MNGQIINWVTAEIYRSEASKKVIASRHYPKVDLYRAFCVSITAGCVS